MTNKIRSIDYYKSNKGIFLANRERAYADKRSSLPKTMRVNGKPLEDTHSPSWYFVEGEEDITLVEEKTNSERILVGYTLKDPSLEVEGKIPLHLNVDDVDETYCDEIDDFVWGGYSQLQSLYERQYEVKEGEYVSVEVDANLLGVIEGDVSDPISTTFSIHMGGGYSKQRSEIKLLSIAHYSEIDEMLVPGFAIHEKPCAISSKDTYNIIRTYLKDNIDPSQAQITSDYDSCFTVKKKVAVKPWTKRSEIFTAKGNSYRPPRYKQTKIEHKLVEIFEMTNASDAYKGYTIIEGFKGDSLKSLAENIYKYLEELVSFINTPVAECSECEGTGHIISKEVPTFNK